MGKLGDAVARSIKKPLARTNDAMYVGDEKPDNLEDFFAFRIGQEVYVHWDNRCSVIIGGAKYTVKEGFNFYGTVENRYILDNKIECVVMYTIAPKHLDGGLKLIFDVSEGDDCVRVEEHRLSIND